MDIETEKALTQLQQIHNVAKAFVEKSWPEIKRPDYKRISTLAIMKMLITLGKPCQKKE